MTIWTTWCLPTPTLGHSLRQLGSFNMIAILPDPGPPQILIGVNDPSPFLGDLRCSAQTLCIEVFDNIEAEFHG